MPPTDDRTPTAPQRPTRTLLPPAQAPAAPQASQRPDYTPVLTLLILVAGCLGARALGSDELAIALGSGALGYAGAQRSALGPVAQRAATAIVFVLAASLTLVGCGANVAQVVKPIFDAAQWTCGVVQPVCAAAELACDIITPGPSSSTSTASTSGGEFDEP